MQIFVVAAALVAFVASSCTSAFELEGPLTTVPVGFVPKTSNPFSNDGTVLFVHGTCNLQGRAKKCIVPITGLAGSDITGRRELQTGPICDLVNIVVGATSINVAGLVIDIPADIVVNITGQVGLVGELLCSLLGGGALLADILAGLEGVLNGVNDLSSALDYLTNALNNLV